jgi:hypothetical protein
MNRNVYEIFDDFTKANTRDEKIAVLRKNECYALRNVLQGTFDSRISFTVEKVPNYKPSDAPPGMGYSTIHQELSRVYLFESNNPKVSSNLSEKRKEEILIQILEVLEKREAEIFMNMLMKKQKVPGLTEKIVREAFPNLLP